MPADMESPSPDLSRAAFSHETQSRFGGFALPKGMVRHILTDRRLADCCSTQSNNNASLVAKHGVGKQKSVVQKARATCGLFGACVCRKVNPLRLIAILMTVGLVAIPKEPI